MKFVRNLTAKSVAAALAMFVFTQCNDDVKVELLKTESASAETTTEETEAPVLSLTIDGIYTVLASVADCKTCHYVVPENASVVDGNEIGIKPGQAICLSEDFNYGNLKIINLKGEEKNPIVVAYGVKNVADGQN